MKYFKLILILFVLLNLINLSPLLKGDLPSGGDNSGHYTLLQSTVKFLKQEQGLWNSNYNFGYPMFYFYGPLPYFSLAILHLITQINLLFLFKFSLIIFFSILPLIFYQAARLFDFNRSTSFFVAFLSVLVSTYTKYGIEPFAFFGFGLFSQLFSLLFSPFALAYAYRSIFKQENKLFLAALFLTLSFLSNPLVGYFGFFSIGLMFLFHINRRSLRNTLLILIISFISIAFLIIPALVNQNYYGGQPFDPLWKTDGPGIKEISLSLISGKLFDINRLPIFTILFFLGIVISFRKEKKYFYFMTLFLISLFLFSGRTSFGEIINFIPGLKNIQLFKFIILIAFSGIFLAAFGLNFLFEYIKKGTKIKYLPILIVALVSSPLIIDTAFNSQFRPFPSLTQDLQLQESLDFLKEQPPGRLQVNFLKTTFNYSHPQVLEARIAQLSEKPSASNVIGSHDTISYFYSSFIPSGSYDLFNIKYILTDKPRSDLKEIFSNKKYYVYQTDASGYFDLVQAPVSIINNHQQIRPIITSWLFSPQPENKNFILLTNTDQQILFNPEETQLEYLEQRNQIKVKSYPIQINNLNTTTEKYFNQTITVDCGQINNEIVKPNTYAALVNLTESCYILLKVSAFPEWRAYLDGRETEVFEISPTFMAIKAEPGQHNIIFLYKTSPLRKILLLIAVLNLVAFFFIARKI